MRPRPISKLYLIYACSVLIIAMGASLYFLRLSPKVIATVGDYTITEKDKSLRDQIQKIYYPQDSNSYGLTQLIAAYTFAQILKNNGHEITDHILRAEEMRINHNTKSPETLKKIRRLFKGDNESLKKIFVLPTYAERTIYFDFFIKNTKAQERSLQKVQNILEQLRLSTRSFKTVASDNDLISRKFTLSKEKGIEWHPEKEHPQERSNALTPINDSHSAPPAVRDHVYSQLQGASTASAEYWVDHIIKDLKPGEVLQKPVDYQEVWLIVKYHRPISKNEFQMEAVLIPKDSYQQWLRDETAKILIKK